MKRLIVCSLLLFPALAPAQHRWRDWRLDEHETIHKTFPVSAGAKLLVDNVTGYIHVTGTSGNQVQVTVEKEIGAESAESMARAKKEVTLDAAAEGNTVRLYVDGPFRSHDGVHYRGDDYYGYRVSFDYEIQVPFSTELNLKTINGGEILVKKTTGDFEIHGLNGGIDMQEVSGAGTVRTLNGPVKVSFSRNPSKASEFRTLNGSMDIRFQPGLDADMTFKKLNGGVYADFDLTLGLPPASAADGHGRFEYHSGRTLKARAGKGGPALTFDTLNGNIRLYSKAL